MMKTLIKKKKKLSEGTAQAAAWKWPREIYFIHIERQFYDFITDKMISLSCSWMMQMLDKMFSFVKSPWRK